jgi:hypothetical protein
MTTPKIPSNSFDAGLEHLWKARGLARVLLEMA